jgi:hypothetical protein
MLITTIIFLKLTMHRSKERKKAMAPVKQAIAEEGKKEKEM